MYLLPISSNYEKWDANKSQIDSWGDDGNTGETEEHGAAHTIYFYIAFSEAFNLQTNRMALGAATVDTKVLLADGVRVASDENAKMISEAMAANFHKRMFSLCSLHLPTRSIILSNFL